MKLKILFEPIKSIQFIFFLIELVSLKVFWGNSELQKQ